MDEKQIIEKLIQDWALEWKSDQEVLFKKLFLAIYYKTKGKKEKNRISFGGIVVYRNKK